MARNDTPPNPLDALPEAVRELVEQVNEESVEAEEHVVGVLAQQILDARVDVKTLEAELVVKKEELRDAEIENARRLAATPPEAEADLTLIQDDITTKTTSLDAKRNHYRLLLEKARRVYPKYFKRKR